MARVALDHFLLGDHGEIRSGDEVPEEFTVGGAGPHTTDFSRLEALGCVAPVKGRKAKAAPEPVEEIDE